MERSVSVDPPVPVRTEEVALRLEQIRRKHGGPVTVKIGKGTAERGHRNSPFNG
jgi:hypothetical protein